jgi:arsenate reductase (glutaredoxin)
MIFYGYTKCSTCRDALKWLKAHHIIFEVKEIRETPPSYDELKFALDSHKGEMKKILNTSGLDYRAMELKDKIGTMSKDQIFLLISDNGNLCKRPFLIDEEKNISLVGFHQQEWEKNLI